VNSLLTWRALLVFICAIIVDWCWGCYIRRSATGNAIKAANWGLCILLLGVFNTLSWLENRWMLLPLYAGAWIGTFVVIKWDHKKKSVPETPSK
jgi:hypothetical protein